MATDPVEDAIYGLGLSLKMASANVVRVQRAQLATVLTALRDKEAECADIEAHLVAARSLLANPQPAQGGEPGLNYKPSPECLADIERLEQAQRDDAAYAAAHPEDFIMGSRLQPQGQAHD